MLRKNCLLKQVILGKTEEEIEVTGRQGRRRKQLLDNLKKTGEYFKLKEDAVHRIARRTRFGKGRGPVVRETAE
jgi:hypothetical protein